MNHLIASPWNWENDNASSKFSYLVRTVAMFAHLLGRGEYQVRLGSTLVKAFKIPRGDKSKLFAEWGDIKKRTSFFDESRKIPSESWI